VTLGTYGATASGEEYGGRKRSNHVLHAATESP
jgi:hypothetical protein